MQKVTVKKADLVAAVEKNRAGHRKIFEEALDGYKAKQVELLEAQLKRLRAGKRLPMMGYYLPVPEDHTKDYDRVLRMLEMSLFDVVEISQEDFAKYVMDDWEWRRSFLASNSAYSSTAAAIADSGEED